MPAVYHPFPLNNENARNRLEMVMLCRVLFSRMRFFAGRLDMRGGGMASAT